MEIFLSNSVEDDIVSLFFIVNDFSNWYDDAYGQLKEKPKKNPTRELGLAECEIMTILLLFFQSHQKFLSIFIIILMRIIRNFFQICHVTRDLWKYAN